MSPTYETLRQAYSHDEYHNAFLIKKSNLKVRKLTVLIHNSQACPTLQTFINNDTVI